MPPRTRRSSARGSSGTSTATATAAVSVINPGRPVVAGRQSVASLAELPVPADLVCIAVPADRVVRVIEECGAAEVGSAIVYSSGFAEAGDVGAARQAELVAAADRSGVVVVRPSGNGIVNVGARLCAAFGMALEVEELVPGSVALVSQSGAIASSRYGGQSRTGSESRRR